MINENLSSKIEEDIQYAKAAEHLLKEQQDELRRLLEENLRYQRAVYADTQKIRRYMFWRMIINIIWVIMIIGPIILAVIYLPPALQGIFGQYQELLGTGEASGDLFNQLKMLK